MFGPSLFGFILVCPSLDNQSLCSSFVPSCHVVRLEGWESHTDKPHETIDK